MQLIQDEDKPEDMVLEEAPNEEAKDKELKDQVSSNNVEPTPADSTAVDPPPLALPETFKERTARIQKEVRFRVSP